jgi:hypothetical protein
VQDDPRSGQLQRKQQMQMWIEYKRMVNQQCYLEVLTKLQESFQKKDPNSSLTSGFSTITVLLRVMC